MAELLIQGDRLVGGSDAILVIDDTAAGILCRRIACPTPKPASDQRIPAGDHPSEQRLVMGPRPFWKGYLTLARLLSNRDVPASPSSERVSFRQINKSTGNRLKQQLVDSVTGDVVEPGQKGRGYEIGRNQYMPVEDEELRLESTTRSASKNSCPGRRDERYLDSPPPHPIYAASCSLP